MAQWALFVPGSNPHPPVQLWLASGNCLAGATGQIRFDAGDTPQRI